MSSAGGVRQIFFLFFSFFFFYLMCVHCARNKLSFALVMLGFGTFCNSVHCPGNDSQLAVQQLQAQYTETEFVDVIGGVVAWSNSVDHSFPVY